MTAVASTPVRIFLTGGAGFIGSHFVRNVLTGRSAGLEDANLTVLDALSYSGNRDNLTPVASDPRLAFFRTHGFDIVLTRCSNTYGPYQFPEKLIPLFVTNILDGGTVPLYGDGLNIRDWLHVDDHCLGIALVLGRGRAGEVYHVGGGTELTNRELTEKLLVAWYRNNRAWWEPLKSRRRASHAAGSVG